MDYKRDCQALLEAGRRLRHPALTPIAGWRAWDENTRIIGGRFLNVPGELRGRFCQDSGYRHKVAHSVSTAADHRVTAEVPATFPMTDELYLYEVPEDEVTPLLRSDYAFEWDNFYSAARVVRNGKDVRQRRLEPRPRRSIWWVRLRKRAPAAASICRAAMTQRPTSNPHGQRLIANAIDWVSS